MNRRFIIITIFHALILNSFAQSKSDISESIFENSNLVLNHSFEEFQNKTPCNFYQNYKEFNDALIDWKSPTTGKPLVFNVKECNPDFFYSAKEDSIYPHSGNTMIGLRTYKFDNIPAHDYIQGTLKKPLVKNEMYYIAFFVSRNHNGKFASNNLGFCFIDTPVFINGRKPILLKPDFEEQNILEINKGKWIKLSGIIKAKSQSSYFLIGNFNNFQDTEYKECSKPRAHGNSALLTATYFIDDVVVIKYDEYMNYNTIDSVMSNISATVYKCDPDSNLVLNSGFNDYETYNDENYNIIFDPKHWHYNKKNVIHPIYYSTKRYLDKSIIKNNFHPDSKQILQGQTVNYIGIPMLPEPKKIYTKLNCELLKDSLYTLEVDVKSYDYSNCFTDLMVAFSEFKPENIDTFSNEYRLITADSITSSFIHNNWITLSIAFKAKGNEKYLSIGSGNSQDYKNIIFQNLKKFDGRNENFRDFSLKYCIDNVILKQISLNSIIDLSENLDSLKVGDSFVLESIFFEFDKDELKNESFTLLYELLNYLSSNLSSEILIIGHTDNSGNENYNIDLSNRRAKRIYDFLISNGINNSRIQYKGKGSSQPLVPNETEEDKKKNRRVEIEFIKK